MPHPYPRTRESADARAALMAKLPSQFPLESDNISCSIRNLRLQAERQNPYRVRVSSTRNPTKKCRKTRLESSLGWGAFLMGETLRTIDGNLVRVAQEPCPTRTSALSLPCLRVRLSQEDLPPRDCRVARATNSRRCSMLFAESSTAFDGGRCGNGRTDDMPSCGALDSDYNCPDTKMDPIAPCWEQRPLDFASRVHSEEQLCIQAADDMFMMFIDETCMEVD
ncbi:hypothetical protein C8R45DRAFT_995096 [Mycena sanguinolenta]|nr:hypothetical protein C8R45DRAFT_995096 [Mycena sanguinolenta]